MVARFVEDEMMESTGDVVVVEFGWLLDCLLKFVLDTSAEF